MTITHRALTIGLAATILALGCSGPAAARLALAPGDKAPEIRSNDSKGEIFLPDYTAKKLTVVNFWATWCEPCKDEMPALQRLHGKYAEVGLQVVGILHDNVSPQVMQEFADGLGVSYPVVRFRGKKAGEKWSDVRVLPLTFLINSEGVILRRYVGSSPEQIEGLITDVEAVLADQPLGPMVVPVTPAVAIT